MNANKAQQLADRLQKARNAYYNGVPIITDAAYDTLEDQLRELDRNHPLLAQVGVPGTDKVAHAIPMGSLNKAQEFSDMSQWYQNLGNSGVALVVTDKLDGASIELVYRNKRLVRAVTRGDGLAGDDVTNNAMIMQGIVKTLPATINGNPTPDNVYIRGEVIVTKTDFAKHFTGESNPRNSASGTMKRQSNAEKCRYLTVITYQILTDIGNIANTKAGELQTLSSLGFQVPRWEILTDITKVQALYQEYINAIRDNLNYQIDGLVVEVDGRDTWEAMGDSNGRPKGSIAYKFPHESKPTILRDIRWQVGNSGRVTPVAEFDAVVIGGRKIEKASLATVRQVKMLKLYKGCKIMVSLRNDVIPRVESNLSLGIDNDE